MLFILCGCLSFLLFIIYDINQITIKNKIINSFFVFGFVLLCISTVQLSLTVDMLISIPLFWKILFGVLAGVFLFLLFYSLFFALPFQKTYMDSGFTVKKVYDKGVYAMSRHPGVLFFFFFYVFYSLFLGNVIVLIAGLIFTLLNVVYIFIQDRIIFPKQFENYQKYIESTPFLIPTKKSMNSCIVTLSMRQES